MKLLFISPKITKPIGGNLPSFVDEERGKVPPLGIMYLASSDSRHNEVHIYDEQIQNDLDVKLITEDYDMVGISVLTFTLLDTLRIMKEIRKFTRATIMVGGTHPTIYPREMLKLGANSVIMGEGDSVYFKKIETGIWEGKPEENLDNLLFPRRMNIDKYNSIFSKGMCTSIITSRGCPYSCKFCHRPATCKFRMRSPENVAAEIEECVRMGIRNFQFYDDTFLVNYGRAEKICKLIKPMKVKFDIRTRVNLIRKGIIKKLKEAGMVQVRLGIESGVQKVLDRMNKGITLKQIEKAFKMLKGTDTVAYIMFGNPGETLEDIGETRRFVKKVNPTYVHAGVFTPYPATETYREWVDKYDIDVWQRFASDPKEDFIPPVWGDIPRATLEKLVMDFYKEFYARPSYIAKNIWKHPVKFTKAGLRMLQ